LKIYLVAFRGTGNLLDPNDHEPALIKVGHVGIHFEDDPRIFGFSPSQEAIDRVGGESAMLRELAHRNPQAGTVKDDTTIFERANELFEQLHNPEVLDIYQKPQVIYLVWDQVSETDYFRIKQQILEWYNKQITVALYNFPTHGGGFLENQYNCSTLPLLLGLSVPSATGFMKDYIKAMINQGAKRWQPKLNLSSE
jgi:hypothetical protein